MQSASPQEPPKKSEPPRINSSESDADLTLYNFGNIDNYELCYRIGRGKYSTVFYGLRSDGKPCALKVLKQVRPGKIFREISILEALKNGPNISKILDVVRDPESQTISLIVEWTKDDFRSIYQSLSLHDIAYYTYQLLLALNYAHSHGIMHRDVKPQNIMIDHTEHKVSLIDWGLADYYVPGAAYQVRVATRHYKGPELLFEIQQYTTSLDIWGLGATFGTFLLRKTPFFRARDNNELIYRIADFVGSEAIENYIAKYKLNPNPAMMSRIAGHKKKEYEQLKKEDTANILTPEAYDLLMRMLTVDHNERISAQEALEHPFFDEIRKELETEM